MCGDWVYLMCVCVCVCERCVGDSVWFLSVVCVSVGVRMVYVVCVWFVRVECVVCVV
jgi:hypothetical protein